MTSFINIGLSGASNLAVVAPGIAEALIATAIGLFAAIPAVLFYNFFINRIRGMATVMSNFSTDFLNTAKRSL
jgi:biopolymer transport protein ExbB/TolQ